MDAAPDFLPHQSNADGGFTAQGSGWDSISVRHAFIRKVSLSCHGNHSGSLSIIQLSFIFLFRKSGLGLTLIVLAPVFQVYLVLASQLIVTTAIVSVFTFV